MHKTEFSTYLNKYIEGSLSPEEISLFMKLLHEHTHDVEVKEAIDHLLTKERFSIPLNHQKSEEIRQFILTHTPPPKRISTFYKVKRNYRKVHLQLLATAIIVTTLLLGGGFLFKYNQPQSSNSFSTSPSSTSMSSNLIKYTGKQYVDLPDGSKVLLNDQSTLTYNTADFDKGKRTISFEGEAFFDITHDTLHPFVVNTGEIVTKVLGTAFNIKAYANSNTVEVAVSRGKVQVGDTDKVYGVITPNQQIKVNTETLHFIQETVNVAMITDWKSNYLILDDIPMREAIKLIENKYHVAITFEHPALKNCIIKATFLNNESLDHVLTVISSVLQTTYTYDKNTQKILLSGEGCP